MLVTASSGDEVILNFVRDHVSEIRSGEFYCQLTGGDGVNVMACIRRVVGQDMALAPLQNTDQGDRTGDKGR
jgi:hypothetical protein